MDLVRITFTLDESSRHDHATERLWADAVGDKLYRIKNTPFYAYGVSFEDVVSAEKAGEDLAFVGVILRGGHSTYRILLVDSDEDFSRVWLPLEALGCRYEGAEEGKLYAVDVPPAADIQAVYRLLEEGEHAGVWRFEEGHCGHPVQCPGSTEETS